MYLLVISEILGLFVNTLTANDKYFLLNRKNLQEPIRTQLSKKQKLFVNFLQDFWRLHQVLNNLKIKVTLIADIFLKLQNVKSVVTKMSKNPRFRMPFDRQHVKVSQTLLKSVLQHFYHKITLAEIVFENACLSDIWYLRIVFNTLTADDKYSLLKVLCYLKSEKYKTCSNHTKSLLLVN